MGFRKRGQRLFPIELLSEAKLWPGQHVFEISPGWDRDGQIPPAAIVGAWPIDQNGEPTGEFVPNPNYDPSLRPEP